MVSILMPAYNAEKFIEPSIQSVLDQTYPDWELMIINDGSTDGTQRIAEEYSKKDQRIKVINQENKKLGAARNTGIRHAKGTWIAFLDADDLWHQFKLEKQITFSNEHPDIDLIYTGGWIFSLDNLTDLKPYVIQKGFYNAEYMYRLQYEGNCIPILSVIIKKDIVAKTGLQGEDLAIRGCEDWDYWIRVARTGATFYGMEEELFYYRRHDSNMSSDTVKMGISELSVLLKNFDPQLINIDHFVYIFKKKMKYVVIVALKEGKVKQLKLLLFEINKISNAMYLRVLYYLLYFKGTPHILIKLLNRFDSVFYKSE